MIKVEFLGPINREPANYNIKNLNELSEILKNDNNLLEWLEKSAVAINGKLVFDKNIDLQNGDIIAILPPVCGG
jgi:molybdopterin synthase sulfur carrier subunit